MIDKFKISIFIVITLLLFNTIIIAEKIIDPYNYELVLGKVTNLQGEAFFINENNQSIKLKNNNLLSTQKIKKFMLIYNDNAQTLIDGRKDMAEKLTIKTSANGKFRLLLTDDNKKNNYLLIGPNTEIKLTIKGGCLYTTEFDGEGYDIETLKWRDIKKNITWNIHKGKVKVLYQKNNIFRLGAPNTENAKIYIDNQIQDIEYEVIVLTGEEASKEKIKVASLTPEMTAQIEAIKNNYLLVYKVDKIENLPTEIKSQLNDQIANFKTAYQEAENNMNNMMNQTRQIVTILKVYKGEAKLEDTKLTDGELAKVKGDIERASTPEKF